MPPLNPNQWNRLITELKNGNCCLFLGTGISCLADNGSNYTSSEYFATWIRNRLDDAGIAYNPANTNHLYLVKKYIDNVYKGRDSFFVDDIKAFKNELNGHLPQFYKQVVQLPFRSVVCTAHDNFFSKALNEAGYVFHEETYEFDLHTSNKVELDDEMQLVLNILGTYEKPASIPCNEKRLLTQIKNITNEDPRIETNIKVRFTNEQKTFIFLGFDFNEWYFRLILDSLKVPSPVASYYPLLNQQHEVAILTQEYYSDNYGINFLGPDTFSFLEELIQHYEEKYGPLNKRVNIAIDYHPADQRIFDAMLLQLTATFQVRNPVILSTYDILPGEDWHTFDAFAAQADVYIPFISAEFLNDQACAARNRTSLINATQQTLFIQSKYVDYPRILGNMANKAIVLPKNRNVLSSLSDQELNEHCYKLSRLINSIVR
jgi:hypothetical protein